MQLSAVKCSLVQLSAVTQCGPVTHHVTPCDKLQTAGAILYSTTVWVPELKETTPKRFREYRWKECFTRKEYRISYEFMAKNEMWSFFV